MGFFIKTALERDDVDPDAVEACLDAIERLKEEHGEENYGVAMFYDTAELRAELDARTEP